MFRYWNIGKNDTKFNYYLQYVLTVATAKYNNLEKFYPFKVDSTLNHISMLDIATAMKAPSEPTPIGKYVYNPVITELGVCYSTTHLYHFQNPYSPQFQKENPKYGQFQSNIFF